MGYKEHYSHTCGCTNTPAFRRCLLHAAAPEMRDILTAFVKAYDHIGHGCWPVDAHNPRNILGPARALLARIEGKE